MELELIRKEKSMSAVSAKPTKRYTAVIKIVEVTSVEYTESGYNKPTTKDIVSTDTELASIIVRAGNLETLKSDISAHVALVKDMDNGTDNAIQANH